MNTVATKTPVIVFLYKRTKNFPDIVNALRVAGVTKLYLVADGPKPGEEDECNSTRHYLESLIDWRCKIVKYYSRTNIGFKTRFTTGLNKVFKQEEAAIIVEDDCVPHVDFFKFCHVLLEKYRDDPSVMTISGNNFLFDRLKISESYYFSRYPLTWGWATWRRAWKGYDPDIKDWVTGGKNIWLREYLKDKVITLYWKLIFDLVKKSQIKAWDYQLTYHGFQQHALHIIPVVNLVTNVGADNYATHTKIKTRVIGHHAKPISMPLVHPKYVSRNPNADKLIEWTVFLTPLIAASLMVKSFLVKISEQIKYVR